MRTRRQIISVAVHILIGLLLVKFGNTILVMKRESGNYVAAIGMCGIIMGIAVFIFLFGLLRK